MPSPMNKFLARYGTHSPRLILNEAISRGDHELAYELLSSLQDALVHAIELFASEQPKRKISVDLELGGPCPMRRAEHFADWWEFADFLKDNEDRAVTIYGWQYIEREA